MAGVMHFPWDEVLIFGTSLCIIVPVVLEMLALHHSTSEDDRFWTHAALIFTTVYAVFGSANYVVQLATVIPAKIHGSLTSIQVLEQTPHSLLWDFDALAYISLGLAMWLVVPALGRSEIERRARWSCIANLFATALAGVVYFYPTFSSTLLLLGLPWAVTAPLAMLLLALTLRERARGGVQRRTPYRLPAGRRGNEFERRAPASADTAHVTGSTPIVAATEDSLNCPRTHRRGQCSASCSFRSIARSSPSRRVSP
jgi:hypothetical protein